MCYFVCGMMHIKEPLLVWVTSILLMKSVLNRRTFKFVFNFVILKGMVLNKDYSFKIYFKVSNALSFLWF